MGFYPKKSLNAINFYKIIYFYIIDYYGILQCEIILVGSHYWLGSSYTTPRETII